MNRVSNIMRAFFVVLLLILFSCQSTGDSEDKLGLSSQHTNEQLPDFVNKILKTDLKGWNLASMNSWVENNFQEHLTDSSQINYFVNDYNCDGKPDFAGILKDSVGNYASFKIYSIGEYYISDQLESYGKLHLLNFGLRYIDSLEEFQSFDGTSETFKCGAIERFNIEDKGKKLFYGDENGFYIIEVG